MRFCGRKNGLKRKVLLSAFWPSLREKVTFANPLIRIEPVKNRENDLEGEGWVSISTIELPVVESLTLSEAEHKFCGAHNMLGL